MSAVMNSNAPHPERQIFSNRSSSRFFYIVDAIGRAHEPTPTQLDALASAYTSTGEYLATCEEFNGLLTQVHPHGSRELGTLVRPIDPQREGFDIDLFASLTPRAMITYGGSGGPTKLLNDLFTVAARYAKIHGLKITRSERCVTLEYAGGMTADIAPIIQFSSHLGPFPETMGKIPDRELRLYDTTNPLGYAKAFSRVAAISPNLRNTFAADELLKARADSVAPLSDAEDVFPRLLSRIVQLLKLHRNVSFGMATGSIDLRPTSIFLTTLAAEAYAELAPLPHDGPLDLLLDIIEALPRYLDISWHADGSQTWHLDNPSAPGDNLASGMNLQARQEAFRTWVVKARADVEAILHSIEVRAGNDAVLRAIESAFGDRAARGVRNADAQSQASQRVSGHVKVVTGLSAAAVSTASRAHTFFGD